jgi:hypothetical protein
MSDINSPVQIPVQSPLDSLKQSSVYERFSPRHLWLADQVAQNSRAKNDLGGLFANAQMGYTPDDQEKMNLEGRLQELTQQFVDSTKHLDDSAYQQAANDFMAKMGAPAPQRQTAGLNNPNLFQSGFALLAAALDPRHAAEAVSQPFAYQLQDQQTRQGQLDQQFGDQVRTQQQGLNAAESRMTLEERKLGREQASQDRQSNAIRQVMGDIQARLTKIDSNERAAINQAFSLYQSANRADEKQIAGQRLQVLLGKSSDPALRALAPTDNEIAGAADSLRAEAARYASQEWEKAMAGEARFGEVPESRFNDLEAQRYAIAKRYGIDPANLRVTRTGKTIQGENLALAQDKFKFLKSKTADDFKLKWANYQLAKERTQMYGQAIANNLALGLDRNAIAEGNLRMRGLEFSARDMLKSGLGQLKALKSKVDAAATLAARSPSDANDTALEKARIEMEQFIKDSAGDLGIDLTEALRDPVGTMQKLIDGLDQQAKDREIEVQGAMTGVSSTGNPVQNPKSTKPFAVGDIGGSGKGTKPTVVNKPTSAKPGKKTGLPPGIHP